MAISEFPPNPSDGMIFEIRPGLHFVYEAATNAWVEVVGDVPFPLATPARDGVMAASDLRKINRLLIPYPRTTIKGESCRNRYASGNIAIYGTDGIINIAGTGKIQNKDFAGVDKKYRLTKNTAAFDFTIDKDALVAELTARGQINLRGPIGQTGKKGIRGKSGGYLPIGQRGQAGATGAGPACPVTLVPDNLQYQVTPGSTKAIIDIETRAISSTSHELILKRGVIGNPNAAPMQLLANCGEQSAWVLATLATNGVAQLYYVDVFPIIAAIREKFTSEVERVRKGHEDIVGFWLGHLKQLFDQEKSAICCALFNCLQRVATLPKPVDVFPKPLEVAGAPLEVNIVEPNPLQVHQVSSFLPDFNMQAPTLQVQRSASIPSPATGPVFQEKPIIVAPEPKPMEPIRLPTLVIKGENAGPDQAASLTLPAGRYKIMIAECCLRAGSSYVGDVHLVYAGNKGRRAAQFPRVGTFSKQQLASRSYVGLTLTIEHFGGPVYAYCPSDSDDTDGTISITFAKEDTTQSELVVACTLTAKQVAAFEQCWTDSLGCSVLMDIEGTSYIMVAHPEPATMLDTDCRFKNLALAWPTLDGQTFMMLDQASYRVKMDRSLINIVQDNIARGKIIERRGCQPTSEVRGGLWVSMSSDHMMLEKFSEVLFPVLQ